LIVTLLTRKIDDSHSTHSEDVAVSIRCLSSSSTQDVRIFLLVVRLSHSHTILAKKQSRLIMMIVAQFRYHYNFQNTITARHFARHSRFYHIVKNNDRIKKSRSARSQTSRNITSPLFRNEYWMKNLDKSSPMHVCRYLCYIITYHDTGNLCLLNKRIATLLGSELIHSVSSIRYR